MIELRAFCRELQIEKMEFMWMMCCLTTLSCALLLSTPVSGFSDTFSPLQTNVSGEVTNSSLGNRRLVSPGFFSLSTPTTHTKGSPEYLQLFVEETQFYNDLALFFVPVTYRHSLPHIVQTWFRNYVAGSTLYLVAGTLWCLYIYQIRGSQFFAPGTMPSQEAIWKQISVAMQSMPLYVTLPTVTEYMVERGWTRAYSSIGELGFFGYLAYAAAYMAFVEFCIYWMHRELHEIKPLYKLFHATHHIYNKQNTLSPFAGLAFHPVDGILQASPHIAALCLFPMHFFTHEALMFLEALWTTNIHDNVDEGVFPILGAAYHTIHHTTYRHNYGHYTILMDWLFGTLKEPERNRSKVE